MKSIPLRLWALSLLSAVLQFLPFPIAGPAPLWRRAFCWFCLVPLLMALLGRDRTGARLRPGQAALVGYLSGVVWYFSNCYWIYRTMHVYEQIPALASLGILLLFALYVGLYHGVFGALVGVLHRRGSRMWVLLAAPWLWVAVELARARITGFPWDLLGYTQVDNLWVSGLAAWTGVVGLSFVVAAVNSLWLLRVRSARAGVRWLPVAAAALVMVAAGVSSGWTRAATRPAQPGVATLVQENLSVGLARANAPESKEHMLEAFSQLSLHPEVRLPEGEARLLGVRSEERSQLIVWPEAPTDFVDTDPVLRSQMSELARSADAPVIVNDVTFAGSGADGRPSLYNSASFYRADGSYAGRYDKMHLVPFGEYTPYKPLFFFVGHLLDDLVFLPGTKRTLFEAQGRSYGVFICYESIFGDDLRRFAQSGAEVLVNISDDGWYGDTSAPWEHLDMVRMRAIENRRWIVRATNTGITAAIDPSGRVTETLPRHIRSSIQVGFGYRTDLSFYTRYGDWFGWLCAGVSAAAVGLAWGSRRGRGSRLGVRG